jgi:isopenicillin-N N-acyltransferase-like protein
MTDKPLLPILRVQGSHRDVGRQIGQACTDAVRAAVDFSDANPRDGRTLAEQLKLAEEYRDVTAHALPYLVEELDGVAEAAGVDPLLVFAASIEEIWAPNDDVSGGTGGAALGSERGRCSDLVAGPPATADGSLLVAHNNDLDESVEPHLTAIDWNVDGESRMFTIGIGPWLSVGWNAAGVLVSGNELSPNDNRIGIPRLLLVREELRKTSVTEMVDAALRPDRASSYNNIFAARDGEVVDIEGSGTDAAMMTLNSAGTMVHTNHYVCEPMLRYEDDHAYAKLSGKRLSRGTQLLDEAAAMPGSVTKDRLVGFLSDHENAPDSLCRHPVPGRTAKTVFWCVTDVTTGHITFGRGNPCDSARQTFQFDVATSGRL